MSVTKQDAASWAHDWLLNTALPIWWGKGADRIRGGFHEALDQSGSPTGQPKRMRVQARQIFVYAEACRLGWSGPWSEAIHHALDFLRRAYLRPDGYYRTLVTSEGVIADDSVDLYDQAFVLLGLAAACRAGVDRSAMRAEANRLTTQLLSQLSHPLGGFEEAVPRRIPLRSNPHMHLLEAMIAWHDADGAPQWLDHASAIVNLATGHMIDPASGAIGEYFDARWKPMCDDRGLLREPGHQFEWAFLLDRAGALLGHDLRDVTTCLSRFALAHGVDAVRGATIFSVDADGRVLDGSARLWAQTEWLRTALTSGDPLTRSSWLPAWMIVRRFLDAPIPGLWHDRLAADGAFAYGPAPASSLYHLVTAFASLIDDAAGQTGSLAIS